MAGLDPAIAVAARQGPLATRISAREAYVRGNEKDDAFVVVTERWGDGSV